MSKLTTKEVLFITICSQFPIGMIMGVLLSHTTTNIHEFTFILASVLFPLSFLFCWFAEQVKK